MMITDLIRALTPKRNAIRIHPMNVTEDKPQIGKIEKIEKLENTDPCTSIYDRHRKPGAYDEYQKTLRIISPKTV